MIAWHALLDSGAVRTLTARGPGRALLRSRAFRAALLARNRALSASAVRRDPARFACVRTFCLTVGHNKSGASLLGGLLDAHRDAVLADEADALRYVEAGFGRDQLFSLLLRNTRAEARKGRVTARRLQQYSYAVPGQWQGRSPRPLVVGDTTTGMATRRLGERPELLERLSRQLPGVDVRLVQVIRNPFDPISAMIVRGGRSFEDAIGHYFAACRTLVAIRRALPAASLLEVRYEDFVRDPERGLRRACRFVGVDAEAGYLAACGAIVRRRGDRSREWVPWTGPWIDAVERQIAGFAFLEGYSYEG